jgi:hypothetical protein
MQLLVKLCFGLDDQESIPGRVGSFSSPQQPDQLGGLPSLPSSEYRSFFLGGESACA